MTCSTSPSPEVLNVQTDFIAYVRYEEKLLLLRRHSSDASFPGLWDGVYGSGSTPEEVLARVAEVTGLSADQLVLHKEGPDRGIDMLSLIHI